MAEPAGRHLMRSPLAELLGGDGDLDELADAFSGPLYWPDLPAEAAADQWAALRAWVEDLVDRFALDSHLVPNCWWRHPQLVEVLAALRDHERGCYAPTAPPTAAVEFHRALRDIEARLRAWVAELRCEAGHHPTHDRRRLLPADGWDQWVAADVEPRRHPEPDAPPADA